MGFFFTKQAATKPPVNVSSKPKKASKASKDMLNRLGCKACPLDKANNCTPKMQPDLADRTDVYFMGDVPSEVDDEKGYPFESSAGRLLRSLISFDLNRCSLDNVVRDYDHYREQASWVAMECCRSHITSSIAKAKPKVIVGLGLLPLQWMLNSSDMVGLRGRVFAVNVGGHACYFIPTYHPQFVMDTAFDPDEPVRSKLGHCLKFDLKRAFEAVKWAPPVIDTPQQARAGVQAFTGHKAGDLAAVLNLLAEAAKARQKAIDLETYPLRPYAEGASLLTAALSYGNVNFAFAMNHPQAGWKPEDKKQIRKALKRVLSSEGRIIAHNTPFECEWLIAELGIDAIYQDNWECTMMQSHFLDERRGKRGGNDEQFQPNPYQALDFLVKQYFGISYKGLFKIDRKNMNKADLEETLLYNGADTKYTLRLYEMQTFLMKEAGLWEAYKEARERQPVMAMMQSLGIHLDQATNKKFGKRLTKEISAIQTEINSNKEVQAYIADHKSFNPASGQEVVKLLKDYLKVGKVLLNEQGKEATDKSVLNKISHPFAKQLDNFRNRSKLKSTYVDPFIAGKGAFIWPDGKLHPSFNTTFAETGRTSSDEPNQQNWPSRNDKWVRRQITAPKGHVLVAFDYGQLEACTAAMCTRDKVLVKALWEDYDIHMEWAVKAAHRYPEFIGGIENLKDKDVMKKFRSLIKNKLVFPVFFGAKNESVAGYLNAPIEPVNKLMDEFWRTFYGVHSWQKRLMHDYYNLGYVGSPTGRRRHFPLSKNQAVNYPIQSVACDIVCRAMVNLSNMAAETGRWYLHPIMNIHDDLTFCIPDNDQILDEAIETIYRTMLTPPYSFVNVPLSVSGSVGDNWLDMEEIGKFWSHRDL